MMAEIAVIVPVYKVEPYLRRCVDSILNQTFADFELILVDDGSPDNCGAICDEYAKKDNRVVVIHQRNGGQAAARNVGINYVFARECEWVSFVDSDDWIHQDFLKVLYTEAEDNGRDIVQCGILETKENIFPDVDIPLKPDTVIYSGFEAQNRNNEITVNPVNKLYRKDLWANIRFPVGKIHEDTFTIYKVTYAAKTVSKITEKLYYYFQSENSTMRSAYSGKRLNEYRAYLERIQFYVHRGHLDLAKMESIRTESCLSDIITGRAKLQLSWSVRWQAKFLYWKLVLISFPLWNKKFWLQRCLFAVSPGLMDWLYQCAQKIKR